MSKTDVQCDNMQSEDTNDQKYINQHNLCDNHLMFIELDLK
jgi:hypothetical protein